MNVQGGRVGNLSAVLSMMKPLAGPIGPEAIERNRRRIANIVRAMGDQPFVSGMPRPPATHKLPPRLQQTLAHLLSGSSEKEIAAKLEVSKHTVHVYVKGLYRHFGASSRAELLARWVRTE